MRRTPGAYLICPVISGNGFKTAGNETYGDAHADGSAILVGECDRRVMRGAAWDDEPEDLRSANRLSVPADRRYNTIGIRVVRELN